MFPFRRSLYLMLTFSGHRVNQMPLGRGFSLVGATGGGIAVFQQIVPTSTSPKANDASRKAGVFTMTWYQTRSQASLAEKLTVVR